MQKRTLEMTVGLFFLFAIASFVMLAVEGEWLGTKSFFR